LREEKNTEINKLDDEYSNKVNEAKKKLKNIGLKHNSGFQLIEEKFRLDMMNTVGNLVSGKNYK
jgi:hypothetical protein